MRKRKESGERRAREDALDEGSISVRTCHLISTPCSSNPMGWARERVRASGVADAGKELWINNAALWNEGLHSTRMAREKR